jgi:hypothetical protein
MKVSVLKRVLCVAGLRFKYRGRDATVGNLRYWEVSSYHGFMFHLWEDDIIDDRGRA